VVVVGVARGSSPDRYRLKWRRRQQHRCDVMRRHGVSKSRAKINVSGRRRIGGMAKAQAGGEWRERRRRRKISAENISVKSGVQWQMAAAARNRRENNNEREK